VDWRCGSSGRGPALQVRNPELKLQSHQRKFKVILKSVFFYFIVLLKNLSQREKSFSEMSFVLSCLCFTPGE
jgi:hypothetical protein